MTIKEMQYQFGQQLNQFNEALDLESDDIEYWINKAQLELVKEIYNGSNNLGRGFEQSQQRTDDLRVLVKRNTEIDAQHVSNTSGTTGFETDSVVFPNDYMFLISHKSKIVYNYPEIDVVITEGKRTANGTEKIVLNKIAQSDTIYRLLNDPFNKPRPSSPISVITEDKIYVFTDKTFIVDKVFIDYIKYPREVNIIDEVDSELPEHLHKDIIQRAVDLFLNNTRQLKQRLQRETPIANNQQNEIEQ